MAATAVATQVDKRTPMSVAQGLKPQLAETLPRHINPDAFARTLQTALQVQPDLLDCTPRSLMISCMKAATDGLILDGREAALIVRKVKVKKNPDVWETQATYQPMVHGLMKLARNSGEIVSITAHVVYQNDMFRYVLGDDERIEHAPASLDGEQGPPIAAYAIVKLKDGTSVREVMRASSIMNIAGQGKNEFQYRPESGKNFAEWWRKTVIRRITKYIPRSSDAIGAFTTAAERIDEDFDFEGEVEKQAPPPTQKKRGGGAAALRDVTPKHKPEPEHDGPTADYDAETGEFIQERDDYGDDRGPGDDI